ncbi:hypothetical protein CERSUDRAFT_99572 [Gelatoporia subvermispora B]|uniref:F-box domain-containing protein n=1 Tax=Ceriporiopsis subvermispora (strain B) TaxID=914234 RepID=M2QZX9_CERS8|nr:hypothetical protein CERSUDRAFT_99572 [Gelatoporia subvermispora B]
MGLATLLRDIELRSPEDTQWLHSFMFADPTTRFPLLKALRIYNARAVAYDASHIVDILQQCKVLEKLFISPTEKILKMDSRITPTICGLTSLKYLTLEIVGERTFSMFLHLLPPLTSLSVKPDNRFQSRRLFCPPLPHMASTLTSLEFCPSPIFDSDIQYPHVINLALYSDPYTTQCHLDLQALTYAFPNVTTLSLKDCPCAPFVQCLEVDRIDRALLPRSHNISQKCATFGGKLRYLEGPVDLVWALALSSPVQHLVLIIDSTQDLLRVRDTLNEIDTCRLTLKLNSLIPGYDFHATCLRDIAQAIAASSVSHVAICFNAWESGDITSALLITILDALSGSLSIAYMEIDPSAAMKSVRVSEQFCIFNAALEQSLQESLAQQTFTNLPCLRYLLYTTSRNETILWTRNMDEESAAIMAHVTWQESGLFRASEGMNIKVQPGRDGELTDDSDDSGKLCLHTSQTTCLCM